MSTTQLFVELIVIGFGVMIWFAFLIAGVKGLPFDKAIFDIKLSSFWPPLLGIAYVFGILLDRVLYYAFGSRKKRIEEDILKDDLRGKVHVIERIVMTEHDNLNYEVHYNRTRMRICRAWFLNFILIGMSLFIWQSRVKQISPFWLFLVVAILFSLSAVSYWAGNRLEEDHLKNIEQSYIYIREKRCESVKESSDKCQSPSSSSQD